MKTINKKNYPKEASPGYSIHLMKVEVKRALKAVLKGTLVTNHVLQTVFAEVESILNSRPLTRSSEDASDATTISPAHPLLQKPAVVLPPGEFREESVIRLERTFGC